MKATTHQSGSTSQWGLSTADLQPHATAVQATTETGLDALEIMKILGKEFWNFLLLKCVFGLMVARVVVPLAVIVTNDLSGIETWAALAVALSAPLLYGFAVARSGQAHWRLRLGIECVLFVLGFALVWAIGLRDSRLSLLAIAATTLIFAAAALWGKDREIITAKNDPGQASFFGFFKESFVNVLAIGVGLSMCIGSRYAGTALEAQVQNMRCAGKTAPALNLISPSDEKWSLDELAGKVVVVEFWSPHCLPCVAAIATLEEVQVKFGSHDDFEMVGVSLGDQQNSIEMFETIENPWTLAFPQEQDKTGFEPPYIPMTYIIGRDGTVVEAGISADQLENALTNLLQDERPHNETNTKLKVN